MRKTLAIALICGTLFPVVVSPHPSAQDATPPTPSELTRLKWQIIALRQQLALSTAQLQLCQAQVAPSAYKNTLDAVDGDMRAVVAAFEAEHPGWTLDPKTGEPVRKGGN